MAALRWAAERDLPVFILGGGSNLVVGDEGFAGLVVHIAFAGQAWDDGDAQASVVAQAGETWDELVAASVRRGLAELACLSGIPGSAGAAPVQNIGAYGHEIAEVIERLTVLDRRSLEVVDIDGADCAFAYRDSMFKRAPDRFVILALRLRLHRDVATTLRYAELASALAAHPSPDPARIRETVLSLRRAKAMVLDPSEDNQHSAGSFFTNPVVDAQKAHAVITEAIARGLAARPEDVPHFPLPDGQVKLAAGWLIERSGIGKGYRMGPVGISTRHALALVHHGGGSTADLLRLALHVRRTVQERFGIVLCPEPVMLGVAWPP